MAPCQMVFVNTLEVEKFMNGIKDGDVSASSFFPDDSCCRSDEIHLVSVWMD